MSLFKTLQDHGEEAAQTAEQAVEGAEHAAEEGAHYLTEISEIPDYISHHLEDARVPDAYRLDEVGTG